MNEKIKVKFEELYNSLNNDEQKVIDEYKSGFIYLFFKAFCYLEEGPEKYSMDDYFQEPATKIKAELDLIQSGCKELLLGNGIMKDRPFSKLGQKGMSLLLSTLHFEIKHRSSSREFYTNRKGMLDQLIVEHKKYGFEITLFNFC